MPQKPVEPAQQPERLGLAARPAHRAGQLERLFAETYSLGPAHRRAYFSVEPDRQQQVNRRMEEDRPGPGLARKQERPLLALGACQNVRRVVVAYAHQFEGACLARQVAGGFERRERGLVVGQRLLRLIAIEVDIANAVEGFGRSQWIVEAACDVKPPLQPA